MSILRVIALIVAFSIGSTALAAGPQCPKWEAGTRYPWQSNVLVRGDKYAWILLRVDRAGYPLRCRIGQNNYTNNEDRFWLCKQYSERWRGPPASASDPDTRNLQRLSLIPDYKHAKADRRARAAWFLQHPEERQECYPEPSRPDRMDI